MRNISDLQFVGNSRFPSPGTPKIMEDVSRATPMIPGSHAAVEMPGRLCPACHPIASAMILVIRKCMDWSVMTLLLLSIITNTSIARMQANKEAQDDAELGRTSDAAIDAFAEQRMPDGPEKTKRAKIVTKALNEEISRLQHTYN
jgi:hypothetical protein